MSFVDGFVVGVIIGLALIFGFVRSENARSKTRSQLATTIAAFARMTVEDSNKLLTKDQYPSWLVISEPQKLDWLNLMVDKIWPYFNEAASEMIKPIVDPILEQVKPKILKSLTVSSVTLETVAPKFTGVSIIEDGSEGITMELEVQWDGNPDMILNIKPFIGMRVPVEVKNIAGAIVFRLIFRPLVDEFPCFRGVNFCLTEKKLDFSVKVVDGDIPSIPGWKAGIADAVETTIRDVARVLETAFNSIVISPFTINV